VVYAFPALALGAALVAPAEERLAGRIQDLPPANPGFFRAAMAANLTIRPLERAFLRSSVPAAAENYSFQWRIGRPRWLPSLRNPRRREDV
jgi:hypothetical protein